MDERTARAWIRLDPAALRHNVRALSGRLPAGCELMPVLKANAYGHGAIPIAEALAALGIRRFCVATAEEGAELRRAGIGGEILVLGYTPAFRSDVLAEYDLIQTAADLSHARALAAGGRDLRIHLAVDTGMRRLGVPAEDRESIRSVFRMDGLRTEGILSHLCRADEDGPEADAFTRAQGAAFSRLRLWLAAEGIRPAAHILSSAGLLRFPALGGDRARAGIALYGAGTAGTGLRSVLSLRARVALVRDLAPGEGAGYGLRFRAEKACRLAVLTIGYADGVPRELSEGRGSVLLRGKRAFVAGRICMDQMMVDVTHIPDAAPGDEAVLIGRQGAEEITADEMAAAARTIPNEILSRLGQRLPRFFAGQQK